MWHILCHTLRALAARACTSAPAPVSRGANGLPRKAAPGELRSSNPVAGRPQQPSTGSERGALFHVAHPVPHPVGARQCAARTSAPAAAPCGTSSVASSYDSSPQPMKQQTPRRSTVRPTCSPCGQIALAAMIFGACFLGPFNAAFVDDHAGHGEHHHHAAPIETAPEHCLFCVDGIAPAVPMWAIQWQEIRVRQLPPSGARQRSALAALALLPFARGPPANPL